ncbi:peptide ABC transporter substrate-binding protein [Thermoactinospora rubra]|uniref:peptide ABC transporter substrate-binding protein n=1 Tax=Thermoactinospora rubra TaxID=1088767 RepID=UPI000A10BA7B|nr:ABC transporter substrate-binding protein [Thermoactinospora rubra]
MRVTKGAWLVAGTALLALTVAACGSGAPAGGGEGGDTPVRMEIGEPKNQLVPGLTTEAEGAEVLGALFEPLVKYTKDRQAEPNVAESVASDDNKTWTIKLNQGWTWHDGEPLTAQNYVDAWNWAAYKPNAASAAHFFQMVEGFEDVNPSEEGAQPAAKTMKGLEAVDDLTIRVRLTRPNSQFRLMLGYTAFYPLPAKAFDSNGKITQKYMQQPIGMGLFKMDKPYRKGTDQVIDLSVYEGFKGDKPKNWKQLEFRIYSGQSAAETAYNDLQAENIDVHDSIPSSQLISAQTALGDRYHDDPTSLISYIGFPITANPAFAKPEVRKAISMAIDRKTIAEQVFSGARSPADDFISPAVDGYRPGACTEACSYDPAKAKELYAQAGGPPRIDLGYNADGGHKEWMEAVANNLRANLGIQVQLKPEEKFGVILTALEKHEYKGAFRIAWLYDYPSMENYLTPMFGKAAAKGGSNYSGWTNDQFDELINKGNEARTPAQAIKFYQQADDLLLKDMPYVPVFFHRINWGHSTRIRNVELNMLDQVVWAKVEKADAA